jgi:hypothetical protein
VTCRDARVPGGRHNHAFALVSWASTRMTSTFRNARSALARRRSQVRVLYGAQEAVRPVRPRTSF